MKHVCFALLVLCAGVPFGAAPASAQLPEHPNAPSAKKALGLSLLLPGLGHRYVHGGDWDGAASLFAVADAALWLGLFGNQWQLNHRVAAYETLAAGRAGTVVEGKDRQFFLNLASFPSSEAFVEYHLRNRSWQEIDYVDDPSYQWEWASEEDYARFRTLRSEAESTRRRRPFFIALLVTNRVLSGLTAIRAAHAHADAAAVSFSLSPPPRDADAPALNVRVRW